MSARTVRPGSILKWCGCGHSVRLCLTPGMCQITKYIGALSATVVSRLGILAIAKVREAMKCEAKPEDIQVALDLLELVDGELCGEDEFDLFMHEQTKGKYIGQATSNTAAKRLGIHGKAYEQLLIDEAERFAEWSAHDWQPLPHRMEPQEFDNYFLGVPVPASDACVNCGKVFEKHDRFYTANDGRSACFDPDACGIRQRSK